MHTFVRALFCGDGQFSLACNMTALVENAGSIHIQRAQSKDCTAKSAYIYIYRERETES